MLSTKSAGSIVRGASAPRTDRDREKDKYEVAYQRETYRMGDNRMKAARRCLGTLPRGSFLDVGCGRGELLDIAEEMGFGPVKGAEVVSYLVDGDRVVQANAWELPWADNSFDHVSMLDVLEHLLPGDDRLACEELARVSRETVTVSAADYSHVVDGVELHVNRRSYDEWDRLLREWFVGASSVENVTEQRDNSRIWQITL